MKNHPTIGRVAVHNGHYPLMQLVSLLGLKVGDYILIRPKGVPGTVIEGEEGVLLVVPDEGTYRILEIGTNDIRIELVSKEKIVDMRTGL